MFGFTASDGDLPSSRRHRTSDSETDDPRYMRPPLPECEHPNILFLFDVDGTLCPSREIADPAINTMLIALKKRVRTGFVGGSNLAKQREQLGNNVLEIFNYGFPENGLQCYKGGQMCSARSLIDHIGNERYTKVINAVLAALSRVDYPVKRGNFVELRESMINVSPIGRSCSRDERRTFFEYDKKHGVREKLCRELKPVFEEAGLRSVIGGQISIDVFPVGWDKTYCLKHVTEKTIVFFGDMTAEGGNDYEIANHPRVRGVTVTGPEDTLRKINEELQRLNLPPIN